MPFKAAAIQMTSGNDVEKNLRTVKNLFKKAANAGAVKFLLFPVLLQRKQDKHILKS